MLQLPDNEREANRVLGGVFNDHGNWPPAALTPVAFASIRQGLGEHEFRSLVWGSLLGDRLRSSDGFNRAREIPRVMSRVWEWCQERYEPGSREEIRDRATDLWFRVLFGEWPSDANGIRQRAVALALVRVAVERGAYSFPCSARWLAVEAGISDLTKVSACRNALEASGMITVTGTDGARQTRWITLDLGWSPLAIKYKQLIPGYIACIQNEELPDLVGHSAFASTRGSLGPVAGWTLASLALFGDLTIAQLSEYLSISPKAAGKAAGSLSVHGLVAVSGETVCVASKGLDSVAGTLGVADYRHDLYRRFQGDRARRDADMSEDGYTAHSPALRGSTSEGAGYPPGGGYSVGQQPHSWPEVDAAEMVEAATRDPFTGEQIEPPREHEPRNGDPLSE